MRIISGTLRGRKLKTIEGEGYRPAMGKTREALFSMLTARGIDWQTTRALDLFAGSGSLAFEAISRGAPSAVLVENADNAVKCLHDNAHTLGIEGQTRIVKEDVLRFLRRPDAQAFNLVFIDPPYKQDLTEPVLRGLTSNKHLTPQAFVTAEIEKHGTFTTPDTLTLLTDRLFGQTRVCIWIYSTE